MFKILAAKFMAFLTLSLSPNNIELPQDPNWLKVDSDHSEQKLVIDSWENEDLIHQCQINPDAFIILPPIYIANQELWDERNLIESIGDVRKDLLESGYLSKSVTCMKVLKSKKLIWKVYRLCHLNSRIREFPTISTDKVLSNSYGSLVFFICSLILIGLGLFAAVVFRRKVENMVLFNYVGACLCIALYGLVFCSGLWSSGLVIHKYGFLIAFFLVLGINFLSCFLYSQNYLPKMLKLYAKFSVIAVTINALLFYEDPKTFLGYHRLLCFPYFLVFTSYYFASSSIRFINKKNIQNVVIFFASTIFLLSAVNDILSATGFIKSDFIVQAGLLVVLSAHLYFFKNKVGSFIVQRDRYKQKLDEAYQENLEIISKNTVAHTIANTVQRIAHDIKTPFNMLKLTFNELKAGRIDLEQTFTLANHAEKSIGYVDNLLIDLMTASKERPNKLEPLEVGQMIEASWSQSNLIKAPSFELVRQLKHSNKLFVDRLKTERIFINLFNNAKEAMGRKGGRIWVKSLDTRVNGRPYIEIAIVNENSFIAEKNRTKVFSPSYTSGKGKGSGLGLAICHEAVASHGGQIRCQSNMENHTEFVFTLPSLE